MKLVVVALLICCSLILACRHTTPEPERRQLGWSGWIEETAARRGYIKPGDVGQFGCPPGWRGVEDTAAGLRGRQVSAVYMGTDPLPHDGTVTCVAQAEFALPQPSTVAYVSTAANPPATFPRLAGNRTRFHDYRIQVGATAQCGDLYRSGDAMRSAPDRGSAARSSEVAGRSAGGDEARLPGNGQRRMSCGG